MVLAMINSVWINGVWGRGSGDHFESINPATGESVWSGSAASDQQVDSAVISARKAFEVWSLVSEERRIDLLLAFKNQLDKHKNSLAETISLETGKTLWDSKGELAAMIGKIDISIDAHKKRCGEMRKEMPAGTSVTRHRPHGVCAVFGPFNFPGHLPNGHIVPAILAGNCVVFKPSELTPRVAEETMRLWDAAGIPAGVLNLVQGGRSVGKSLAEHSGIDALFFTGSCNTGQYLSEYFGKHPEKMLALELGGNNPLIVWDAKNLDAAAYLIVQSAFLSSGQRCTCARRLILPNSVEGDRLLDSLISMTRTIRVGKYSDTPEPFMGPVIHSAMAEWIIEQQDRLQQSGGKSLVCSELLKKGTGLISPGIIDVTAVKNRSDEEIFGPFLQVIRVSSFEKAIDEANRTRFGLSAGIMTDDESLYRRFFDKSRAGIINWNTPLTGASSSAPFGGIGLSGNHRPSAYYAADYCSYPVASMEIEELKLPEKLAPGIALGVTHE
jgi:succinylglutamic semialdehyde dehydrogenase